MTCPAFDFDFANIVNRKLFYIDKTEYLWNLINSGVTCYFMSRPRRFGKSLTVSTLKYIFDGRKELFKGLAIYDKPYDWEVHPVIHLDMSNCGSGSADELKSYLHDLLEGVARNNNLVISGDSISVQFQNLIEDLASSGNQVVILLDEYDKPILNNISNPNLPEIFNVLKSFYATIKKCNQYERFVFITGVSKFSHVSIFSDLNNLKDISMDPDYATMLGFTQEELEKNFEELIEKYAAEQGMSRDEMVAKIRHWYNGYRFHPKAETVYNPVSATSFFEHGEFLNFWIKTGLSGFLMELARDQRYNFAKLPNEEVSDTDLSISDIENVNLVSLLFLTGYLTLDRASVEFGQTFYTLTFPNEEVRFSFNALLLNSLTGKKDTECAGLAETMLPAMNVGDTDRMHLALKTFFAGIPYNISRKNEYVFQSIFFCIFSILGVKVYAEDCTNRGRIDLVIDMPGYTYIIEFKLNDDDSALKQIHEKKYYEKYRLNGKRIILIGVNFSSESGELCRWETESLG